jgi:hypothetical protein
MLGIDNYVKEYLLQLRIVSHSCRQVGGKIGGDLDVIHLMFIGTQS